MKIIIVVKIFFNSVDRKMNAIRSKIIPMKKEFLFRLDMINERKLID